MADAGSQIRELQGLVSRRTLPHQATEWLLRQGLQIASTNASTGTQTTNAGSSSFLRDEAKALIQSGLLGPRHLTYDDRNIQRLTTLVGKALEQSPVHGAWLNADKHAEIFLTQIQQLRALFSAKGRQMTRGGSPFALYGRAFGAAGRGLSTVGVLSVGINLADAAIKHDGDKAIGILGTTAVTGLMTEGVIAAAGARAVPIVGEVVGGIFAGKDAYDAARSGHNVRAAASGLEAGLYAFSLGAALTGAGAPIALVAGGAAVTMTAARTLRDNWDTVSSRFHKWSNDFCATHAGPTLPTQPGLKPRQLTTA
jgi:hypothetical protein